MSGATSTISSQGNWKKLRYQSDKSNTFMMPNWSWDIESSNMDRTQKTLGMKAAARSYIPRMSPSVSLRAPLSFRVQILYPS
jgi:hypothetical protein